jgi:hypothetical protein
VPLMLPVPAAEVRHPVLLRVLMKANDLSFLPLGPQQDFASARYYGRPKVNNVDPAATATNCFPSTA